MEWEEERVGPEHLGQEVTISGSGFRWGKTSQLPHEIITDFPVARKK